MIGLFVPCYVAALRPRDVEHARRVLESLGDDVDVIDGVCCGQPAFNSGFRAEAKSVAREALRAARDYDRVVVLSGSCASMVMHYAPGLWEAHKREGAERIAGRFVEFASYVAGHSHLGDLGLRFTGAVAYHDSCHNRRELSATGTVTGLLSSIEGLDLRRLEHEDECCGFGGTFNVKYAGVAGGMAGSKLADVAEAGAPVLVSTDVSCLAHLTRAGGPNSPATISMAELLAQALPR